MYGIEIVQIYNYHLQETIANTGTGKYFLLVGCYYPILCKRWGQKKLHKDPMLTGLGTHLFVKVPQPGDSERTF